MAGPLRLNPPWLVEFVFPRKKKKNYVTRLGPLGQNSGIGHDKHKYDACFIHILHTFYLTRQDIYKLFLLL